jgi:hypothetical protein
MSVSFIPGQEFKTFNFKVKIKKKRRRSGNRGRRTKKKNKDSYSEESAGTSTTGDDVGMFTRIVHWICSLFTWKTLRPQTEQKELHISEGREDSYRSGKCWRREGNPPRDILMRYIICLRRDVFHNLFTISTQYG